MSIRALIYVQHLLGSGHAVRAAALADALAAAGAETLLVTGNRLPPAARDGRHAVADLPHARARDAAFSAIVDATGAPVTDAWRAGRRDRLLGLLEKHRPHILVTETWPFGRNGFAFELEPLVEAAWAMQPRPLIASSIRDILVRKQDVRKERRMAERARVGFDLVLVHGDPHFVPLDASFAFTGMVRDLVAYTGYIHGGIAAPHPAAGEGDGEVVVSCGGGAVGQALLETAMAARNLSAAAFLTWRLLVGHDLRDAVLDRLRGDAPIGVIVERARPDFPGLLARARLSVSQCGYNTAVDVMKAQVPAVFVPFAAGGETEQSQRADALAERGLAVVLEERALAPPTLAAAVDKALQLKPPRHPLAADGAREAARILLQRHAALAGRA